MMAFGVRSSQSWAFWNRFRYGKRRMVLTAVGVAACVLGARWVGLLQTWELSMFDYLLQLRPPRPVSDRVVLITIDEPDLQTVGQYPVPDRDIAAVIRRVQAAQPRAIGLDLYRDLPVPPGHADLATVFQTTPNLVVIEHIADPDNPSVPPPPAIAKPGQVGFNNVVHDLDDRVRRGLLYSNARGTTKAKPSFALTLALRYCAQDGLEPRPAVDGSGNLQIGNAIFRRFRGHDGAYAHADEGGYQILLDPRGRPGKVFRRVSLAEVLQGKVSAEVFRDRVVLIGYVAVSANDFVLTAYSRQLIGPPLPVPGVELHANFVSQLLGSVYDQRPVFATWPEPVEGLWVLVWAGVGVILSWRVRSLALWLGALSLTGLGIVVVGYGALLLGWWVPVVPPFLGTVGAAVVMTAYIARLQEQYQRSKEFLNSIINTIPDPIFVKDEAQRWIVLNEAFAHFLQYPLAALLERSVREVLPPATAEAFAQHDDLVFKTGQTHQHESAFQGPDGVVRYVETKRSLHKDAAGNLFLVGVIRDITERKRMEEELKQTAAELRRSNAELQRSASQLNYAANHDSLTGLPNRKLFYERLHQAIAWAATNQRQVGVLFLDLDGFKQVNDTLGHDVGDLLLKAVATRLTGCLRGSDTVARLGGDEFTVILPAIPSTEDAVRVAEKLLATLAQAFVIEAHTIAVTTSIGISLYPGHGDDLEPLIKAADNAMYAAKQAGKNCYTVASLVEPVPLPEVG